MRIEGGFEEVLGRAGGIRFVTVRREITVLRGSGRSPAFLIANDFESSSAILRRYACRWHVELSISEQLAFSNLTVTIVAYNLLRLLACDLPWYLPGGARKGPAAG